MGASETAVENFAVGEVRGQAFPHANARATREESEVGDGFAFDVLLFEGGYRIGEPRGVGVWSGFCSKRIAP